MHVERLTDGSERLVQAMVIVTPTGVPETWWTLFAARALAAPGLDPTSFAYRLSVTAAGDITLLLAATASEGNEPVLRRFMGGFAWLEGEAATSVDYPESAEVFLRRAKALPAWRQHVIAPPIRTTQGPWLARGDRLTPCLAALAQEAVALGHAFSYQVNLAPFQRSADQLRRIGRNVIALEDVPGLRPALLSEQRRLFEQARRATLIVEEFVATDDTPEAKHWLSAALTRLMGPIAAERGLSPPSFPPVSPEEESIALMLHGAVLNGEDWTADDLICAQTADEAFWAATVRLRPPQGRKTPPPSATRPEPMEPPPGGKPPVQPVPPHFFLSYRRSDFPAIRPVLTMMVQRNIPVWYDGGIEVGTAWIEVLERKIDEATAVLAMMSPDFLASRYCRREIMYADTIGKPILPIVLVPGELGHGLRFILHATQMLDISAEDFWPLLMKTVDALQRAPVSR
jgi:hypothetical protein